MIKWFREHCFKDKENWFGKRYINLEYSLINVAFCCFFACIIFIISFYYFYVGGNSFLVTLVLAFGSVIVSLGFDYLDILYGHFIKNKRKKD